jgi:hypothetical protein
LQEDWVLCRVFYRSRTVNTRPAAADVEAGSLSNDLISLPMPHAPPVDAYLLAFDHAPAVTVGGFHYQQDDGGGLPEAQAKSLSSFRELLTSMVGRDGGADAKAELHHQQDWDGAAYAGAPQTWNPFLNSG